MFNLMLKIIVDVKRLHLWRVGCSAAAFKYGNGDICVKAFSESPSFSGWANLVGESKNSGCWAGSENAKS